MEQNKTKSKDNVHVGHRERLKKKANNNGIKHFADHELLELLLTYTIPRKDTNPIAHNLMTNYNYISNVVDADYNDLLNTQGVGKETALFFNVLSEMIKRYEISKTRRCKEFIKNTNDIVKFFRKHYSVKNFEQMLVICINKNGEIVKTKMIEGVDNSKIEFSTKEFAKVLLVADISAVAIIHTHPNGDCLPSEQDVIATEKIFETCVSIGLTFIDHLIFNETNHYSFRKDGNFDAKMQSYLNRFGRY